MSTDRAVVIRPATTADAPAIAAIYAPYVSDTVVSFEEIPPSPAEMADRIAEVGMPWFVAEVGSAVVGYAYASPHRSRPAYRWSVDVSVYLSPQVQGRGLGRRLYQELLPTLRELHYRNAFAGIALPNPASLGLHEALGFVPLGVYRSVGYKLGSWHDVGWWQLALGPADTPPRTPDPWSADDSRHATLPYG